jgi:AcrR family transcriptional regulator
MPRVVPEYKEKAKGRIVEVAHKVFSEKGYHAATMDDVAHRLGVSKGALYQYFKSKEDLYRAILNARFRSMTDMLPSTSAGGGFSKTCQQFFESLTSDVSGLGLGFEVITEASRNPALAKVVRENYSETTNAIRSCLEQWRKDGSLRKDMNIDLVTRGLIAFYDGLMVNLAVGFERSEVRKVFSEFTRVLEDGMLRKAA